MIAKENFVRIIDALRTQYDQEREFSQAIGKYFDGHPVFNLEGRVYNEVIDALTNDLRIKWESLEWWIWEADFGRGDNNWMKIQDEKFKLSNAGEFYDFIINHLRET